ncbi:TPA: hypothetical protein ACQMIB_001705, partial [Streptococcus pyogenes]|uniref:hypothetical protein n=2 Tax=Streptococcus pyogenes TaxID=1314 RepID=UPI001B34F77A
LLTPKQNLTLVIGHWLLFKALILTSCACVKIKKGREGFSPQKSQLTADSLVNNLTNLLYQKGAS